MIIFCACSDSRRSKHALRNSLVPLATNIGHQVTLFVTGSFLSHFVLHLPSHTLLRVMDITMWLGSAGLIVGVRIVVFDFLICESYSHIHST